MACRSDIALVPLSGDLNVQTAPAFRRTVDDLLSKGCRRLVLNMADVSYVDSAGMAVIFGALRRMREGGMRMSLINVSPDVLRALKIARLVDMVPVSAAGAHKEVPELDPAVLPLWRTAVPVDGGDLQAARQRIESLASRLSFGPDALFDLTLAAGEALGNAVDHTCGTGVLATVSAYPDRMVIEVTDCGDGFDPRAAQRCHECSGDERGRGIKLMRLLVDSVTIQSRQGAPGTVVRLVKLV